MSIFLLIKLKVLDFRSKFYVKVTKNNLHLITLMTTKKTSNKLISCNYAKPDNILWYLSTKSYTNSLLHKILLTPYATVTSVLWKIGYITIHIISQNKWILSKIHLRTTNSAHTVYINVMFLNNTHLKTSRLATIHHCNKLHYVESAKRYEYI